MAKTYLGIDISEHNENVDWAKVAKKVDFAILRICWVGNNSNQMDIMFEKNYKEAKEAGIKLGAYVYMYSKSTNAAEKGAEWLLQQIKGKSFDLPIYCDMEDPSLQGYSAEALTAITNAFNKKVKSVGYDVGVYANLSWFNNKLNKSVRSYHTWIAHYTSGTNKYKGEYEMWQNSSTGKVDGVKGNVDTNYLYEDIFKKPITVKPVTPTPKPQPTTTYKKWTGYVTTSTLNIRVKPNTNCDILGTYSKGTAVTIEGESGKFYKITFNKKTAYVSKDYISKTKPVTYWTGVVTANTLNVRQKASTSAKILGTLKKGETTKIYGESGNFYKTTYKNQTAYVYKSYIKKK
jgi:GH25 family lysozyme M1 (1,4-beta-N-acetylmuramidase)